MSGTLFVVATPIGNLEDITLRALRVLREAQLIAAEDTRRTAKLLAHYSIHTPTTSFHQHNTRSRTPQLLARLERGERIALVTDAGTPGISDPGIELVQECLERGIRVDPIPGASAPLTAAVVSGFPLEPLTVLGFPPTRAKDRMLWMQRIQSIDHTFTFFEAPHRIRQTLTELSSVLGERQIVVAKELTKVHQEFIKGTAANIIGLIPEPKGEFTVLVGPTKPTSTHELRSSDKDIYIEFGRSPVLAAGGRRQIIAALARKHGRTTREVYGIIERLKNSGI